MQACNIRIGMFQQQQGQVDRSEDRWGWKLGRAEVWWDYRGFSILSKVVGFHICER